MPDTGTYLLSSTVEAPRAAEDQTWKPLRFLNLYRLALGALFAALYHLGKLPPPLGADHPVLFYGVSLAYVGFALAANVAIHQRTPGFTAQVYVQLGIDIVVTTVLMHASGGLESGLGMLLVVTIASAGMLTAGRTAGLFAALATFAVLSEEGYSFLWEGREYSSWPLAGMLGATLFATAGLARVLAQRIRDSETLAAQRGLDLANMARLTEYIIQQLDAGVVAVDAQQKIRLMNAAAWRLLGRPGGTKRTLAEVSPALAERLDGWLHNPGSMPGTLTAADGRTEFLPRVVRIGGAGYILFLDDATQATTHAQQLKLAALGRLTASIAHEVRNPLGAIGHAGELLAESSNLDRADRRLTEIIAQQVQRVNAIIESILQLGRRDRSQPETILLKPWLERFVQEFVLTSAVAPESVAFTVTPADLCVHFDPNHLRQILWNLCQNGLQHARNASAPQVRIHAHGEHARIAIDVIDGGPGVTADARTSLFEPFFTSAPGGTGLGLYISRELAQCNRARLDYVPSAKDPGRFRISLGVPEAIPD